MIFTVLFY
jgi:hypothetical protein